MNFYECLCVYIEDVLGVEIKLFVFVDYVGVIQGFVGGMLDFVWLGVFFYVVIYL